MTVRRRILSSVLLLCLCGTVVAHTFEQVNGGVPPKDMRVTLLVSRVRRGWPCSPTAREQQPSSSRPRAPAS